MATADSHPAAHFVHAFHEQLTRWFSGSHEREATLAALAATCPPTMSLVYPSGLELSGDAFIDSIAGLHGKSPGFEATITDLELLHAGPEHAVVRYVEGQTGAKQSAASNRRSAFALIERSEGRWRWRHIQETAMPSEAEEASA